MELVLSCHTVFNVFFISIGHSGVCPTVRRPPSCPPEISFTCESDIDCKLDQKCCFDGCGKACVSKNLGMLMDYLTAWKGRSHHAMIARCTLELQV